MKLSTNQKVGILYALPALAVVGAWVLLLVIQNPPPAKPLEVLIFVLAEKPALLWLRWFLALPLLYVIVAAAYFTSIAAQRAGAITLLVVGAAAAVVCWTTFDVWLATVATVPVIGSYLAVREKFVSA